jgi:hypothetical protein
MPTLVKAKTIHSCGQMEWFKQDVDDKSIKVGGQQLSGQQHIKTLDGYAMPLNVKSGLPYMDMHLYMDDEWESLPHLILTSDDDWNPSMLDHNLNEDKQWFDAVSDLPDDSLDSPFDAEGNYRHILVFDTFITNSILDDSVVPDLPWLYQAHEHYVHGRDPIYSDLHPNFAWLPKDVIQHTFACTTQYAQIPMSTTLKKHYKSPFPAMNVHCRNEALATDTVYSDVPAIDNGATIAQLFIGLTSTICDVYPMKTEKAFVNTLEDVI